MPVTLELRLLLLALALRGEAVSASVSPPESPSVSPATSPPESPSEPCGAALADVLRRLRELEGHVQALRGHCGDKGGPQAGTGRSVQLCAPPAGGGCACPAPSGEAPPPAPPPACPRGCSDQGRCERGRCRCFPGFAGPDCAVRACAPGWGGARCDIEVPWVTPRLASRTPTSLRITWPQPLIPPDGYRVTLVPLDDPVAMTTHELPSSAVAFSVTGLSPGRPFELLVQARRGPHLGAPGVLRLRTALIPSVPHYEGSPGSPQGSLGSPAVAPSVRGPPESPGSPGSLGSPGSHVSPVSPDLSLGSPGSLGSPAPHKVPASPVARGSLGSPAPARSSVSPESPESPASPEFPGSSVSPDFSVSPESPESPLPPESPELPWSPESPVFPGSPPPPWSPVSPWPPLSPGIPSLQDLVARLSTYSGSLLQRLESHLRATNFPLRGNQTVPGVARAILAYILRRHPTLGRGQGPTGEGGNQEPVLEWGDMDGMKLMEPWTDVGKTVKTEPEELRPSRPVLGDLSVTSITPSTMQLQWNVPEGSFDSFMLQYRDAQGQPQALLIDGRSHSVTVPGLSPSHRYRFHLYGLRGEKRIDRVSIDVITAAEEPEELSLPSEEPQHEKSQTEAPASDASPAQAALGELRVTSISPDSVQLQWSILEGSFDSFMLQYRDAQGQPQALPVDGESHSVTVPGLSPSRRYRFHLYGLRGRKKIDHVSTETMTAAAETEEQPLPSQKPQHKKPRTESPASEAPLLQAVLGELRVSSVTPSSVQLHWTVPSGSFDSFTLQYRDAQGQPQALPIDGRSDSVMVPGLSPSHRYRFHLYGLQGRKKIDHVSTEAVTGAEEPEEILLPSEEQKHEKLQTEKPPSEAPMVQAVLEELRVSSVTPDSVQLQWSVPEGSFDSFTLQYRDAQGQPQALPIHGGSRSVTVPGLSPSRRYRFHLYGLRGRKKTDRVSIDIITGATEEPEEPPLPTEEPQHEKPQTEAPPSEATPAKAVLEDLRVLSVTPSSVQLHWTVPSGSFDSFMLQYRDAQGQPQALPVDGGSRSVTVPGLSPSHRYRFHLYGLRGGKRIDHVSTDTVTASEEPLPSEEPQQEKPKTESPASETLPARAVLGELKVTSVTPDSVQLQWNVPEGFFDSFTLQYRDAQGQPQALPIDGESRSVMVPGLSPSQRYHFHLYGLRGRKKIDHISTEVMTGAAEEPEELPLPTEEPRHEKPQTEAPPSEATPAKAVLEDLRVLSVTPSSVQLHWTVPSGSFDSFMLQYRDAQGQPRALPVDGGSRSVTVPGLSPSHRYRFHLYGLRGGKRIDRVSADTVTASEEPLPSEEPQQEKPKTESPASEALPARAVLGELRVSGVTADSVQLQWNVPEGSFDSFTLQYRDAQGQPQALPIDGESRSVMVPGLSPSQRYRFHLYGLRGRKKIDHISTEVMTGAAEEPEELPLPTAEPRHEKPQTEAPPSEATPAKAVLEDLRVLSVTPSSVQLHWTVPSGSFDSFMLQYRDAQGQPRALPVDGGSRSVTVPGLSPSHRYRFHLYGLRGGKRIDRVSADTVTASEEPLPSEEPQQEKPRTESPASQALPARAVLGELKVSSVTADSVQLQWNVPEGSFDSFMLQYRDAQGQPQALPIDGESRSVTVSGLSPSQWYRFHLCGLQGRKKIDRVSTEVMTGAAEEPEELPLPTEEPQHEKPQTEAPPSEATPAKAVLEDLRVSSITPNSVELHWTVPSGSFDSFMLQYRDAQGQPQALPVEGGSRMVTVPGLSLSHRYRFHLYGLRGRKKIDHISTEVVTGAAEEPEELPLPTAEPRHEKPQTEAPQSEATPAKAVLEDLRVLSVTPSSVQLHWTVPSGSFDSFMLQYRDAQGQPQALPVDGGSRSVTVPGLSPSHRYRFHLYGLRGGKRIDRVSADTVTASEEPLPSEEPQQEKPKTESPASETLPARAVLGELKVSSVTADSVQLQWNVPEGSFDSFMLQYRDAQGQPQALPVDGQSRLVMVPGLSPSHRYRFHLYGLRGRKKIDHVSTEVVTGAAEEPEELPLPTEQPQHEKPQTEAPPSEATPAKAVLEDLRVLSVTPSSVQLHWTVPSGSFDSFMLQYRDAQGQPQALPVDGGSRSVTVPGLSPSHRYRFHLYGLRGGKRIDRVSADTVTAREEPLPSEEPQQEKPKTESPASEALPARAVLGELRVSGVTADSVQLQWNVPEGSFDSFMLQYRDAQGQPQALPVDGGSRSVMVPGLSPSQRYRFHLYGLRGRKKIDHVSTEVVTGAAEEPEEPPLPTEEPQHEKPQTEAPPSEATPAKAVLEDLRVLSVTPSSVQLHWTVPSGSFDSFMLQYRDAQGQPQALPVDGGSRSVTVPGLSPSHRYRFHLYGLRGGKRIDRVSADTVTASEEPLPSEEPQQEKPKTESPASETLPARAVLGELKVTSVTPDSVQLQWNVPEGFFDSFTLQYRDAQGQPQALPIDGESRSVMVPGLSPSQRYHFHLYGLRGRKKIDHVSAEVVTGNPEDLPPSSKDPTDEASTTEAPTAQDHKPEHSQTEAPSAQAVLGELKVSSITPDSVQLQWSVPEGSFDSFMLQYRDAQGQPQALPIDGGLHSVTVPGLSPSHRYHFHLYGLYRGKRIDHVSINVNTATDKQEEPPSPSEEPQTEAPPTEDNQPEHPQTEVPPVQVVLGELKVSSITPDSVQLQWSVPEGSFDSFMLQYRDAQGQPQALPIDGGSRSVTVPGLSPSRRYRFHLYGLQGRKRTDRVSTDIITDAAVPKQLPLPSQEPQPEDTQPEQPQTEASQGHVVLGKLRVSSVTPNSVQLQWSVPEGSFDSFTLQYRDAQGQPQALPVDGGSRSVTVPGLSPSRRYRFHLYGLRDRRRIDRVTTDVVTADPEDLSLPSMDTPTWGPPAEDHETSHPEAEAPPSAAPLARGVLGELRVSSVTPSSVGLQWSVPEGRFDSFMLQYRDAQGQPQALPIDGGLHSVTVPGLSPSRRYRFHLYGLRGGKKTDHVSTDIITADGEAAAVPEELPVPSEEPQNEQHQTKAPSATTPARAVVKELRVSSVTPNSVQLQWRVPEGSFDSFMLQYRDAQGQPQAMPIDGESRSVTVPGLSPSHRYRFHLYGLRGRKRVYHTSTEAVTAETNLDELPTPSEEFQPEDPQPKDPPVESPSTDTPSARAVLGELKVSSVTPSSVQLQWSVPEGSFDSFMLQYRDAQGQPQALPIDGESRSVTVPGLSPSHRYRFHLYGLRGGERIDRASTDIVTATAKTEELPLPSEEPQPEDPKGKDPPAEATPSVDPLARAVLGELKVSSVTPSSVELQWNVPEGSFDSFTLQYRDAQGQPQALPIDGGSRLVTVPGLSPSQRYRFHLYGLRGGKRIDHVSTEAITGAPGTLWVGSVWPRSAWLHWDTLQAPPDGYELEYGPPGGPQQSLWLPPEATSQQVWGLEPAGHYGVQLWARGGDPQTAPLEATFDTPPLPHPHPRDCAEEQLNGPGPSRETLIFLRGDPARPLRVFCDMETDGGGWLVFQRRQDGSTDFWRGWESYARGFGNVSGEFWLGNEALHELTSATRTELRVDLRTARDAAFALYRDFAVGGAEERYRLRVGAFSGTAGDALSYHSGSPFSTRDRDFRDPRDRRDPSGRPRPPPCAVAYGGAWWYRNCHYANLNGRYGTPRDHQGIHWFPWKGFNVSIPFTEMKLRPQRG
ncbi:tenascin-X-like isoform X2 [Passer domesticus]|uniref:tenascin-X-like isoform X2 n=1 Tax=Passer domesticus TaxID=48849 RepID=UPI0030FEB17F